MVGRCTDPREPLWARYGGRGIAVCKRWRGKLGFLNFVSDMGERPPGSTIDRIDNDRGYEPGNCRWATPAQQAQNRTNNKLNLVAVSLMRHLHRRGVRQSHLARAFDVTPSMVSRVVTNRCWSIR